MVDEKTLTGLGELARLELTAKEKLGLLKDLRGILNYVDQLKEVKTDKIEKSSGSAAAAIHWREDDQAQADFYSRELLVAARSVKDGYLRVKAVLPDKNGRE